MAQQTFSGCDVPVVYGQIPIEATAKTGDYTTTVATETGEGLVEYQVVVEDFDNTAHDAALVVSAYTDSDSAFGTEVHAASTASIAGSASFGTKIYKIVVPSKGYVRLKFDFTNLTGLSATLSAWWQLIGK